MIRVKPVIEQHCTLLPIQGIGKDNFFLNECLPTDITLFDFSTVGDYARDDHRFQEQARKQEGPDHGKREDTGYSVEGGFIWHSPASTAFSDGVRVIEKRRARRDSDS